MTAAVPFLFFFFNWLPANSLSLSLFLTLGFLLRRRRRLFFVFAATCLFILLLISASGCSRNGAAAAAAVAAMQTVVQSGSWPLSQASGKALLAHGTSMAETAPIHSLDCCRCRRIICQTHLGSLYLPEKKQGKATATVSETAVLLLLRVRLQSFDVTLSGSTLFVSFLSFSHIFLAFLCVWSKW